VAHFFLLFFTANVFLLLIFSRPIMDFFHGGRRRNAWCPSLCTLQRVHWRLMLLLLLLSVAKLSVGLICDFWRIDLCDTTAFMDREPGKVVQ